MKSQLHDVVQRLELAERIVERLRVTVSSVASSAALGDPEREWLAIGAARVAERAVILRERLESGLALPELKALRVERQVKLEQEWLGALRELFDKLVREVGENSPLVEALFPHRRFEKLERGGPAQRTYRMDFAMRRNSTYVQRLGADPEYPFLNPLLVPVERAAEAVSAIGAPEELAEETAEQLRATISDALDGLSRSLRQARLLSEAALIEHPGLFAGLAFDERPTRRSSRPAPEQVAD